MAHQQKEEGQVEQLEGDFVMLRKQLEKDNQLKQQKSMKALDYFLERKIFPMIILGIVFKNGESNSHVDNNNNAKPKRLVAKKTTVSVAKKE